MEDRQPFYQSGAEFRAPNDDDEKDKEKKEKTGKKKSFLSWLKDNVFKSEDDESKQEASEQEPNRVQKFVDSLKGWFNPVTGVEKEEVDENSELTEVQSLEPSVRLPLFSEVTSEPLDVPEDSQTNAKNTIITENPIINYSSEHAEPIPGHESADDITAVSEIIDEHLQDTEPESTVLRIGREIPEPLLREELVNNEDVGIVERSPEPDVIKERETIIENRGGGAALLGLVAAETLSRSRDAKIRKEAVELKKQVTKLEKDQQYQQDEQVAVSRAAERNKDQISKLREKRVKTPEVNNVLVMSEAKPKHEQSQSNSQETLARYYEHAPTIKPPEQLSNQEVTARDNNSEKQKQMILEQIEHAAEQDIALEAQYERMHEAKDVPTSNSQVGSTVGVSRSVMTGYDDSVIQVNNSQQTARHDNKSPNNNLYREAIKQGAWTGIILLVAFLVIVLVWSLL